MNTVIIKLIYLFYGYCLYKIKNIEIDPPYENVKMYVGNAEMFFNIGKPGA